MEINCFVINNLKRKVYSIYMANFSHIILDLIEKISGILNF